MVSTVAHEVEKKCGKLSFFWSTLEGVGEEEQFEEWLKQNKLTKAKDKLKENDITLNELAELGSNFTFDQLK